MKSTATEPGPPRVRGRSLGKHGGAATMSDRLRRCHVVVVVAVLWPGVAGAQMHHQPAGADSSGHHSAKSGTHDHTGSKEGMQGGMDMSGMDMGEMPMSGMYGPYAMSRE